MKMAFVLSAVSSHGVNSGGGVGTSVGMEVGPIESMVVGRDRIGGFGGIGGL